MNEEMEAMPDCESVSACGGRSSTFDELSMQQSLLFSDSLKDLKNLRSQLYSAAEYFELSFMSDDQKQIVVDTLKDYAVKALVNTVDHLGSVSFKVNGLLDEKVDEVLRTDIQVSCIEQRLRTCQDFIGHAGLSQQSLVITSPRYHKRYIIPVDETMPGSGNLAVPHNPEVHQYKEDPESRSFQNAVRSTIKERTPSFRKRHSPSPSQRARSSSPFRKARSPSPSPRQGTVFVQEKSSGITVDRRTGTPPSNPNPNPFICSGSVISRSGLFNPSSFAQKFPMENWKSSSVRLQAERDDGKLAEQNVSKGKRLMKALLSRRKMKKDEMLYTYLDEY